MKILLSAFLLCIYISNAKAQMLQGTLVYSHHNDTAAVNPDSIYSINNLKQKTFITLGFRPRISHNGNYMAFENGPLANHGSQAAVWLRDLVAAKDLLIIPNNDFIDYYDFSPDDAVLIYDYQCSILSAKINGTNVIDLGCTPCDCYSDHPAVRLSDSVITFHNVHYGLLTKNFDGSNPVLIPHTYPGDLYPVWSPDGQWIAYCKTTPGVVFTSGNYVTNAIYKITPDGQDSTLLLQLGATDTLTSDPVWSGDMTNIFFIARIQDSLGIYKVKTDGSAFYQKIYSFDTTGSINDYWLGLSDAVAGTLPVSLTDFNVSRNDKTINLIWHTANETNANYFNIERSTDENNFYEIGSVTAKGNNGLSNSYSFIDHESAVTNAG
ncbi:MAG: hypothetical protein M3015_10685, partial [Bacteroidota bacterium]|nr:hypothetical protein [Bacteroidota bacterium]